MKNPYILLIFLCLTGCAQVEQKPTENQSYAANKPLPRPSKEDMAVLGRNLNDPNDLNSTVVDDISAYRRSSDRYGRMVWLASHQQSAFIPGYATNYDPQTPLPY